MTIKIPKTKKFKIIFVRLPHFVNYAIDFNKEIIYLKLKE